MTRLLKQQFVTKPKSGVSFSVLYSFEYNGIIYNIHNFNFEKFSRNNSDMADGISPISANCFYGKRYRTLKEAIENVSCSTSEADIIIIPPDVDEQTDEEELDENDMDIIIFPNDVPGQLELHYSAEDEISISDVTFLNRTPLAEQFDSDDDIPLSVLFPKKRKSTTQKEAKNELPKWTKSYIDISMNGEIDSLEKRLKKMTDDIKTDDPVHTFERLWDAKLISLIIEQSNLYAAQKNCTNFLVDERDIKIFLGILLLSGYHKLPRETMYWSVDEDICVPFVASSMSRNRFQQIKKYIHFADNSNLQKSDKMSKLRPLMDTLNTNFRQWGIFHQNLSVDEAMIKYFGHHSSKQFIKGKPVRFGFKDWMLCSSTGYCYSYDTYCGAKQRNEDKDTLPLGSRVVLDLVQCIDQPLEHRLYFDNYFSSHDLLTTLRGMKLRATGTVRDNRTKKCPLTSVKEMQKKDRGVFHHMYDKANKLLFVRWKDNSVVTMVTNHDTVEPLGKVKRWSTTEKRKIDVPQPRLFANYNSSMGGVDLLDQAVNNYRICIRGKKWWWPLFTHSLNVAVVNAWRLHLLAHKDNMSLIKFHRSVTQHYLKSFGKATVSKRGPVSLPRSIAKDGIGHFPKKLDKQLRCRQCHLRARWSCLKCGVTLCIERDCFINFHIVNNN